MQVQQQIAASHMTTFEALRIVHTKGWVSVK